MAEEAAASGLRCLTEPPTRARAGRPPAVAGPAPRGRLRARKGEGEAETGRVGAGPCPARSPGAARPPGGAAPPVRAPAASKQRAPAASKQRARGLFHAKEQGAASSAPQPAASPVFLLPLAPVGTKCSTKGFAELRSVGGTTHGMSHRLRIWNARAFKSAGRSSAVGRRTLNQLWFCRGAAFSKSKKSKLYTGFYV